MFSIMLFGFNLNSAQRPFDFTLQQLTHTTGYNLSSEVNVSLVQCTEQHFAFNDELKTSYTRLRMQNALCPPLGHEFTVEGKVSGDLFKTFKILVDRCNATADPTCMDDATFAAIESNLGQFSLIIPIINTNINAGSDKYKEFYIGD